MQHSQDSDRKIDPSDHYAALLGGFRWQVEEHFNIAEVCCSRWGGLPRGPEVQQKK